ncbi:hypothetical protein [Herbiconiux daphne]|uniref:Uncharacterized protein n=1 Tax=Herbiconiux daphne TaxID=2970914 RepID=A0ABT2H5M9_9MICO|nr:hypothetical protein [Herbiconiux daphne]MCS5735241.1 hypothetical protein [Herbiconiux daphne]
MAFLLTIHGDRFRIERDSDLARVRSDIETAARAGGAFVTIPDDDRRVEVLVTGSTPVRIDFSTSRITASPLAGSWSGDGDGDDGGDLTDLDFYDLETFGLN